jgi:hypothetical protein
MDFTIEEKAFLLYIMLFSNRGETRKWRLLLLYTPLH